MSILVIFSLTVFFLNISHTFGYYYEKGIIITLIYSFESDVHIMLQVKCKLYLNVLDTIVEDI